MSIEIKNLYKVFGDHPEQAIALANQGQSLQEIKQSLGDHVGLRNINFDIKDGEIFVVMGLSGSGKSTLLRHFNALIRPTSGSINVDGQEVFQMNKDELMQFRRQHVSMVFQSFALMPHYTVEKNVCLGLDAMGIGPEEQKKTAAHWLQRVGLGGCQNQYPDELSGGMKQRVGLARALATDAKILLMDEAFSALDPIIRYEMQSLLLELQKELKKTVIFITHDLEEALRIGDRILILKDGEILQIGSPEEITKNPKDDHVRKFVSHLKSAA